MPQSILIKPLGETWDFPDSATDEQIKDFVGREVGKLNAGFKKLAAEPPQLSSNPYERTAEAKPEPVAKQPEFRLPSETPQPGLYPQGPTDVQSQIEEAQNIFSSGGRTLTKLGNIARAVPADVAVSLSQNINTAPNLRAALTGRPMPIDAQLEEAAKESPAAATLGHVSQGVAASAPLLALGGLPGWAGRLVAGGFSADMILHAPKQFQDYAEEINKPESEQDPNKIAQLRAGIIQTFAFAPLAGAHALRMKPSALNPKFDWVEGFAKSQKEQSKFNQIQQDIQPKPAEVINLEQAGAPATAAVVQEIVQPKEANAILEKSPEILRDVSGKPITSQEEMPAQVSSEKAAETRGKEVAVKSPETELISDVKSQLTERGDTERALDYWKDKFSNASDDALIGLIQWTRGNESTPWVSRFIGDAAANELRHRGINVDEIKWQMENLPRPESPVPSPEIQGQTQAPSLSKQATTLEPVASSGALSGVEGTKPETISQPSVTPGVTEVKPEPIGMGGAVPSEFELNPNTPTSLKNAQVDIERAKRGLPSAVQPAKRGFGAVWDEAMAKIDRNPGIIDELVKELKHSPRALTDLEDAMLLHRQIDLQNEYGKATRDLAQAHEDGRAEAVQEEKLRVARISDQLLDLYNIGKKAGTETGRGLNARRMMAYEDFTLAQMELAKRAVNDGKPLSDEQRAEITQLHEKIAATQKAYDDYVAQTEKQNADRAVKDALDEIERRKNEVKVEPHVALIANKIKTYFDDRANAALKRLGGKFHTLSPAVLADLTDLGVSRILQGVAGFTEWSAKMIADVGDKVEPYLKQVWDESNKALDEHISKVAGTKAEKVKSVSRKADLVTRTADTTAKIKTKLDAGKKDEVTSLVQKLARLFVEKGVKDRDELIDSVHGVLKELDPEFTRRQTMDAISGYGDFRQLTKDEISVKLRDLKGQMQQVAKLEDMLSGKPPIKTGIERREPSLEERRLIKQVNDAKRQFQIPISDPNTQLKSSLDTLKARLETKTREYQEKLANKDFSKKEKREIKLDEQAMRLKAENEKAKLEFRKGLELDRLKNRSGFEKLQDTIVKWRRGFLLSGPITLAKLTSAAVERMGFTALEEGIGAGISKVIPSVAERAPREGGASISAEAKAITEGFSKGLEDAWKTLKTGQSDLDLLYGKADIAPKSMIDFFGQIHGALKAPTKRNEFTRSFEKRTEHALKNGVDVSDPMVQTKIAIEAYKDANRSIFMQDNRVVSAYKRAMSAFEQPDKATGKIPTGSKVAASTARVLLPIVKVPTNIVAEAFQYATGSVTGSIRLAAALRKGTETLSPEQADLIMRELKKGSIGAAVLLLGYFNPTSVGGYYQPEEKRKPSDVKAGHVKLYGHDIPNYLVHNPLLEMLQLGSTVRRVAESKLRKSDKEPQGLGTGIMAGALGLSEEIPFVQEMTQLDKLFTPHERGQFLGELARSMVVPQAVTWTAQQMDKNKEGEVTPRKPGTILEHIEAGIPGLRKNVPERKVDSAAQAQVKEMAEKWKDAHGIGASHKEFYDRIELAAQKGDQTGIVTAIQNALKSGLTELQIIDHYTKFNTYTGSMMNEADFTASLTPEQMKAYNAGQAEREHIQKLVLETFAKLKKL